MSSPLLTIVSAAHNEEKLLVSFVSQACGFLKKNRIEGEVLIVENGSTDQSLELLKKLKKSHPDLRVETLPEANKGKALKHGLTKAKGKYIVTLDTDLWDEEFVHQSLEKLTHYDIVVGSKTLTGSKDTRPWPSKLYNRVYNLVFKLFFDFRGTETHAKLSFRKEQILPLVAQCRAEDLVFDTELIIRAEREGLSKLEVPVEAAAVRPRRYSLRRQFIKTAAHFLLLARVLGLSPNKSYVALIFSLLIGLFFRFYHYSEWFFISVDEEHYLYMTRMIVVDGHLPAIGGPISGTQLYMAPWLLYFNAVWFALSSGNVLVGGVVYVLLELLVVLLVYLVAKRLFSPTVGALATLLYSSSFLVALFDRHFWNISLVPIISALTFYSLLRWFEGGRRWIWIAGLVVGLGLSTTFSVFALFLFAVLAIAFLKKPVIKKELFIFLGIVAVFHLPLLIFELRHQAWLSRALVVFFQERPYQAPLIGRLQLTAEGLLTTLAKALVITSPLDVSDETSICPTGVMRYSPNLPSKLMTLGVLGYFVYSWIRRRVEGKLSLVVLLVLVNFSSLVLFRTEQGERHWLAFLPLFFILSAALLRRIWTVPITGKVLAGVAVLFFVGANFFSFTSSHASYGLIDKIKAVKYIQNNTEAGQFYLDSVADCHRWGYRYLFSWLGHEPAASYLDPEFSWMYSQSPEGNKAKVRATILAPNKNSLEPEEIRDRRNQLLQKAYSTSYFGNIEVYLEHAP